MTISPANLPAILGGSPVRPDGPPDWPHTDEQIRLTLDRLFQSGDWGRYHGPHCAELSDQIATYHDIKQVHLCSSGTSAVELALRGVGVAPGDEVILAAYDFKANFQNVLCVQAVPVLIDVAPTDWQLDTTRLAAAITPQTRAIIASHLHGGVVDIPRIREIIGSRPIAIIEDACQNPGALIEGKLAGTQGDVSVFSFGGSKLLTAGRGGALLTHHVDVMERIKRYVNRGNDAYPMSELQAAVVIPQLAQLDARNVTRRAAVAYMGERLQDRPGLTVLQAPTSSLHPGYYKVGLRYHRQVFAGMTRDQFASAMRAEGIAIDPGFRGLHLIHAARRFRAAGSLDNASQADENILVLHHPILLDGKTGIDHILTAIQKIEQHAEQIAECTA